jgi:hypothetical protein
MVCFGPRHNFLPDIFSVISSGNLVTIICSEDDYQRAVFLFRRLQSTPYNKTNRLSSKFIPQ